MKTSNFPKGSTDIMDFDFEESRHISDHLHPDPEIVFILEGSIQLTLSENSYIMEKGDIIFIESNQSHSLYTTEPVFIGIIHINYHEFIKYLDTNRYYIFCNSVVDRNRAFSKLQALLNSIFHLYFEKGDKKAYLCSLYFSLLHILTTNFAIKNDDTAYKNPITYNQIRINEIVNYININYQEAITLSDLAEYLHLSPTYLSKYFKKNLGQTFLSYLNNLRLQNAVDDMYNTNKSLVHIALDNGFPNAAAFTSVFKKKYGTTPSIWFQTYIAGNFTKQKQLETDKKNKRILLYLDQISTTQLPNTEQHHTLQLTLSASHGTPYQKSWNRMINIGSVTGILRSDIQAHISLLSRELGITHIRFWDIFTPDMFLDFRQYNGNYNFAQMDRVMDFLFENGLYPFIELGFKPHTHTYSTEKIITIERDICFKSLENYKECLYAFLSHYINRYGLEYVESWYFEHWGDPRITSGQHYGEYFDIFETAYRTLKTLSPNLRIGGAGFGRLYSTLDFKDIIGLWAKRNYFPDFISLYCYPYYPYVLDADTLPISSKRLKDPDYIRNQVLMMRKILVNTGLTNTELFITEYSSSISNWNCLNDSTFKGAFIMKSIIDNVGHVDLMSYYLASDIMTEYYDSKKILHGGNGLLSSDGIKKPSFYAMYFANQLGELLLGKNENAMVTSNQKGDYQIICHNYIAPNYRYYLKNENELLPQKQSLLFDEAEMLHLKFQIRNVKNGKYLIKSFLLNQKHGSVQDEWAEMGYNENLTNQEISYLHQISTPKMRIVEYNVENQTLNFEVHLHPNEIQCIHLIYQLD